MFFPGRLSYRKPGGFRVNRRQVDCVELGRGGVGPCRGAIAEHELVLMR